MVGFWLGVNFIGWFLAVFWVIKPEFLLPKKQLSRLKILAILATILLFDTCLLVIFALQNQQITDVDIFMLIVSIALMVIWTAWCFYRYGRYSVLSKLPKNPEIPTQHTSQNTNQTISTNQSAVNPPPLTNAQHASMFSHLTDAQHSTKNGTENSSTDNTTNSTENTPSTPKDLIDPTADLTHPTPKNEADWQSYKQKMEQAWQETRSKLGEQSKK